MDKKSRNTLIISVIALALVLIGVTYAYFSARIIGLESASTISLTAGRMAIHYSEGNEEVSFSNIYPRSQAWATKTFTLTGTNTTNQEMKYKLGLNVTANTFADGYLTYDLTIVSSTNGTPITSKINQPIDGIGKIRIGSGTFTNANNDTHNYRLDIYFKDNGQDQNDSQEAIFNAKIYVEEKLVSPGYDESEEIIIAKYNNGSNSDGLIRVTHDTTINPKYTAVEYRYQGSNPNNYAYFNCTDNTNPTSSTCELWRIVGLFEVDDGEGNVKQRIKLVRANALGNYSWDSSASGVNSGYGINEWNQADLMNELNGDYLNATENKSWYNGSNNTQTATFTYTTKLTADAQELIGPAKWYLGGFSSNGITRDAAWEAERSGVTCQDLKSNPSEAGCLINGTNDGVEREEYWIGKVGLIYPSDFGYASNSCSAMNSCGSNTNNWMYNYGWTISPHSSNALIAWLVSYDHVSCYGAYLPNGVRPSVYLVSDVQMKAFNPSDTTNAAGSLNNPYVFAAPIK